MYYLLLTLISIIFSLCIFISLKNIINKELESIKQNINSEFTKIPESIFVNLSKILKENTESTNNMFRNINSLFEERLRTFENSNKDNLNLINTTTHTNLKEIQENNKNANENIEKHLAKIEENNTKKLEEMKNVVDNKLQETLEKKLSELSNIFNNRSSSLEEKLKTFENSNKDNLNLINTTIRTNLEEIQKSNKDLNENIEKHLTKIEENNTKKLEEMKNVVDNKLQETLEKRLSESFDRVSKQLSQVHEGLGEVKNFTADIGDLKKVLANVKTAGILGEVQLGAIIEEILSPSQYETNFKINKDNDNRVEYAIKIPTKDDNYMYLPIDAKFPSTNYNNLLNTYETGNKKDIEEANKEFINLIKVFAKDIKNKYINPPNTTNFAIMFLPFEGLYSEVVKKNGLIEELQRKFNIVITGPSTMAALLNCLYISFQAFTIQKRSSEVWKILGEVKSEFEKFGETLEKTQKKLQQANNDLNELIGTRTRALKNKLKNIDVIEDNNDTNKNDE